MKITIISSSQRLNSQSRRVAEYIQKELSKIKDIDEVVFKDLVDVNLPFFDDSLDENNKLQDLWNPLSKELDTSDAFVFITPEWNGMASPMLKNFFLYVEKEIAHKPALLVSVTSNTSNGSYPISEIRSSSYKNSLVCYLPNHVIVRDAKNCLIDEVVNPDNKADVEARARIEHSLVTLAMYAKALSDMRKETTIPLIQFKFGM